MALPKMQHPVFDVIIPSNKKQIKIRQMLVKEEKILLMAKVSEDNLDIFNSIKQIVTNCIMSEDVDTDLLTIFDLEYIFIKIRAVSISNISKVSYRDNEDEKMYEFEIDLNKIDLIYPDKVDSLIRAGSIGISMKFPEAKLYSDKSFLSTVGEDLLYMMLTKSIDKIYSEDVVYDTKDYKQEDLNVFVDNLNIDTLDKMKNFLDSIPRLNYELNYKNSFGNDRKIVLSTLDDFFTLG